MVETWGQLGRDNWHAAGKLRGSNNVRERMSIGARSKGRMGGGPKEADVITFSAIETASMTSLDRCKRPQFYVALVIQSGVTERVEKHRLRPQFSLRHLNVTGGKRADSKPGLYCRILRPPR